MLVIPVHRLITFNDRSYHRIIRIDGEAITAGNQGGVPNTISGSYTDMIVHAVNQG